MVHLFGQAGSDEEASAIASEPDRKIDVLLTDIILQRINGREMSEKLCQQILHLKTNFVSGYTYEVIAHRGVVGERIELIEKLFDRDKLLRRLRHVLDS